MPALSGLHKSWWRCLLHHPWTNWGVLSLKVTAVVIAAPDFSKVLPTASKYWESTINRGRGRTSGDGAREASERNGKITQRGGRGRERRLHWRAETTVWRLSDWGSLVISLFPDEGRRGPPSSVCLVYLSTRSLFCKGRCKIENSPAP